MFALGRVERFVLGALALGSFAGAFATTPIIARSAAVVPIAVIATMAPISDTPQPVITPQRDPFAGGVAPAPSAQPSPTPPPIPAIPALLRPLPPNAGAGGTPLTFGGLRVTAIVSGRHPFALVDDAGLTRIVTVGDAVAGSRVDAIDADAVRLADGSTLHLAIAATGSPLR